MPHLHRHSGAHHSRSSTRSSHPAHGGPAAKQPDPARVTVFSEAPAGGGHASEKRHTHARRSSDGASSGKLPAAACVILALLSLATVLIGEGIAYVSGTPSPPPADLFAGGCAAAAIVLGLRAQAAQSDRWSRRVKRRLLLGLPAAFCTALAVTSNVFERKRHFAQPVARLQSEANPAKPQASAPEDDSLFKPGWYGEVLSGGILFVVTSFNENATESRRFNKELFKPVTYATLSVINTGSGSPLSLSLPKVSLHMDTGETTPCLATHDLLSHGNEQALSRLRRLTQPQSVALGGMLPDIPVCMDAAFDWSRVIAVEVHFDILTVTVPGRMLTAEEKQKSLQSPGSPRQPDRSHKAKSAEEHYKGL